MSTRTARTYRLLTGALLATAVVAPAVAVHAEPIGCTMIWSVPQTITAPGVYCLKQDLYHTSGVPRDAILIEADDVVLDLNGHTLDGSALGPSGFTFGIYAFGRRNITIKNGTIRGFFYGIYLDDTTRPPVDSTGHVIEGIRADRNTCTGIVVAGRGVVVRRNLIVDTGGQTVFGFDAWGWGMQIAGTGIRILDNDIDTVIKRGAGVARGIQLTGAPDALVVGNRIVQADEGLFFDWASSGKYRDNLTSAVGARFIGGTDAGNNN